MPDQLPVALPEGHRAASWEDIVRKIAADEGVNPALALAVARKESSMNPQAIGDGGDAIGMFQLHEGAATDTGTADRSDPIQNIRGGTRYLRQLLTKYEGNVERTLQAYNGGMAGVDEGAVSPAAQAYAATVLADVFGQARQGAQAGRAGGAGPVGAPAAGGPVGGPGQGPPEAAKSSEMGTPGTFAKALVQPFDPRTPEGRTNLASEAASIVVSMIPGGRVAAPLGRGMAPQIAPWIMRVLGPPTAAAVAGGAERAVEQSIGTAPQSMAGPAETAAWQGGAELAGQGLMWPLRRAARSLFGTTVGKAAKRGLAEEAVLMEDAGRQAVTSAREGAREATDAARLLAQADAAATREAVAPMVTEAKRAKTAANVALTDAARAQIEEARTGAALRNYATEVNNAIALRQAQREYDLLLGNPPSVEATADAVKAVVNPGTRGGQRGAAQVALKLAGENVEKAAQGGPPVKLSEVQTALESMRQATYPDAVLGLPAPKSALDSGQLSQEEFKALLLQAGNDLTKIAIDGGNVTQELPKILGVVQRAPTDISFADAHKLKGLLNEVVSWDRTAKKKLEGLTKGVNIALRRAMADNPAYDQATSAYASLVPLYRESVGKKIITDAMKNPDALMHVFDLERPLQAKAAKDLLVAQAAAGGDPAAGLKAWDSVRAAFTYKNLIAGKNGLEGVGERVRTLVTQHPEFAKTVYGDESGQTVLSNLSALSEAFAQAKQKAAADTLAAQAEGKALVRGAGQAAARMKATGQSEAAIGAQAARDTAAQMIRETRAAGAAHVRNIQARGADRVAQTSDLAARANEAVRVAKTRLATSSIGNPRDVIDQATDALEVGVGNLSWFKTRAALRLLSGPKANDILEWAAFSSKNTQRLSALLLGQMPDRAAGMLMRDLAPIVATELVPQKSHQ